MTYRHPARPDPPGPAAPTTRIRSAATTIDHVTILQRLRTGFAVGLVAAVLVGLTGLASLTVVVGQAEALLAEELPLAERHAAMRQGLTDAETAERGYLITGDEVSLGQFEPGIAAFRQAASDALATTDDPRVRELLETETVAGEAWIEQFALSVVAQRADDPGGALARATSGEGRVLFDAYRRANRATSAELDARLADREGRVAAAASGTRIVLLLLLGVATLLVAIVARRTMKAVLGPLSTLTDGVRRLRSDVSVRVDASGPPEIREVGHAVNDLAEANERFARRTGRGRGAAAGARPAEVRLHLHRVPRAADAADQHHRVHGDAPRR